MQSLIKQLLKPRWRTTDLQRAETSPCQWKDANDGDGYTLSILGAINASATWWGVCLVAVDGKRLVVRRSWW